MAERDTGFRVAIVAGSDSDAPLVKQAASALAELGIKATIRVLSAHRSPEEGAQFASQARDVGYQVIIAVAGGAAHLAGTMAARTTLPVIGVPVPTGLMGGLDSLLSTVQMPAGVPVATVGVGKSGARNAGILAAQILALGDDAIAERLRHQKAEMAQGAHEKEDGLKNFLAAEGAE